jgi:drug/metabolite transporter (DMT)-like permease
MGSVRPERSGAQLRGVEGRSTTGPAAPAPLRTAALAAGALVCFAANSLLCRAALGRGLADPATFAAVRLASGAAAVALPILVARRAPPSGGSWGSALVLFAYAVTFSLAYVRIGAGIGALVLFAAVQATMVGWGVASGARLGPVQWAGVALATGGLAWLTLPGADAPDVAGAVLMAVAGIAWGVYSVRGRSTTDPLSTTADNLVRTAPLGLLFLAARAPAAHATPAGVGLAVLSGAVATGGGYAIWYAALPALGASRAGTLQLSVPVIAAAGAVLLLGEPLTHRLWGAGAVILCGVALAVTRRR